MGSRFLMIDLDCKMAALSDSLRARRDVHLAQLRNYHAERRKVTTSIAKAAALIEVRGDFAVKDGETPEMRAKEATALAELEAGLPPKPGVYI